MYLLAEYSIDGPNLELVVLATRVDHNQTLFSMMQALQDEQAFLNTNSHAPYYDLLRELGEDGEIAEEVLRRQIFNWLPGGVAEHKCLELVSKLSRTDVGILWNCTMKEQDVVQVHVSWDSAQLSKIEIDGLLTLLMGFVEELGKRENWEKVVWEVLLAVENGVSRNGEKRADRHLSFA